MPGKKRHPNKQTPTTRKKENVHFVQQLNILPKKGTLAEMEEFCPGSIDRFLGIVEKQQDIDRELDVKVLDNEAKRIGTDRIWVVLNGFVWVLALCIGGLLLWHGKIGEAIGSAVFFVMLLILNKKKII